MRFLAPKPDAPPVAAHEVKALYNFGRGQMLVGLTIIYGFYYVTRSVLDVVKKPLIDAGVFNKDELGTLGACLTAAYAFGKLANGFIADRVSVRRFIPLGLMLTAIASLAMGLNTTFLVACALWLANGYFQGIGAATSVRGLTQWFSGNERGRVYGIWSAAHSIGEGITLVGTAALVSYAGWRAGFIGPGVACVLASFAAAFVLKDRPQAYGLPEIHDHKGEAHTDPITNTRDAQLDVIKNPAVWICALASALMYVTRFGVKSWGVLYLQEARGYSLTEAASIVGVNAVAGILGSIAYGFVSDLVFKARRPPATLLFGLVEIGALAVIFYGPHSTALLSAAFFVYGFALSGILAVLGGLMAVDISSKKAAGMAMGFIGFISYIGATIQEKVSGSLLEKATTKMPDGTTHVDFSVPVAIWFWASILSMIVAATLWRVKPKE